MSLLRRKLGRAGAFVLLFVAAGAVAVLAFSLHATFAEAASPSASCSTNSSTNTFTVTVSNTTASNIVGVTAISNGGTPEYSVSFVVGSGTVNSNCSGVELQSDPTLAVAGSGAQLVELDFVSNSDELLDSGTCLTFGVSFTGGGGGDLILADDAEVGAGANPTVTQTGCQASAITTSGVSTLDIESAAGGTLDLSGLTNPTPGGSALDVAMGSDTAGAPGTSGLGSVQTTANSSPFTIDFGGETTIDGSSSVPTSFELDSTTTSGVSFEGASGQANELDLTSSDLPNGTSPNSDSTLEVAMNASTLGSSCAGGTLDGSVGASSTSFTDCFSNITNVQGSSSTQTSFFPDPTLTSTPSSVVSFTGNDQTELDSVVGVGSFQNAGGNTISNLVIAAAGDSTGSPGTITAKVTSGTTTSTVTFATFSGVNDVLGSAYLPTTFQPGTINGIAWFGNGIDTLDLTASSNIGGFTVAMDAASVGLGTTCSNQGVPSAVVADTPSGTPPVDCFEGVRTVDGSSSSPTTFQPNPTLTASSNVTFVGQDGAAGSDVVDLSSFGSGVSGLTYNAGSSTTAGTVTGTVSSSKVTFASITGANELLGSSSDQTTLEPDDASGLLFVGKAGGAVIDLSQATGSSAAAFTVVSNGNSISSAGSYSGTSADGTGISDTFAGVTTVDGAPKGTMFTPSNTGMPSFVGACGATGPNVVNLSSISASTLSVGLASGSTCSGEADGSVTIGTDTTSLAAVQEVEGSTTTATSFSPTNATGVTLIGQGTSLDNALTLSGGTYSVSAGADNASTQGTYSSGGTAGSGSFQGIETVTGSTGGTSFTPGSANGVIFEGTGSASGNALKLPSSSSTLTVDVDGDSTSSFGQVTIGTATASFSDVGNFSGNPGTGGTVFDSNDVGSVLNFTGGGGTTTLSYQTLNQPPLLPLSGLDLVDNNSSGTVTLGGTGIGTFSSISSFDGCLSGGSSPGCTGTDFQPLNGTVANFDGDGTANTLDFSSLSGAGASLSEAGGTGSATIPSAGSITFADVQTFNGSPSNDTFTANGGSATFNSDGGTDTLSVAGLSGSISVALSASGCTGAVTVSCESALVTGDGTDTAIGITEFVGATSGSTTFMSDGFGGHDFSASGAQNELDLANVTSVSPTVNAAAGCTGNTDCVQGLGTGLGGSTTDVFTGIEIFDGASSATTFVSSGANGLAFDGGTATGDTLALTSAPSGTRVDLGSSCSGSVTASSATETFSDIGQFVGPSGGGATFVASPSAVVGSGSCGGVGAVTFKGQGVNNILDLSAVPTGSAPTCLTTATLDAEPASGPGTLSLTVSSTTTELETFSGITQFDGPTTGCTNFVTGSAGGLTFTAHPQSTKNAISFQEATSGVQVSLAPTSGAETVSTGDGTDNFSGMSTIIGSPDNDTFFDGPGSYTLQGGGGTDTFDASGATGGISVSELGGSATVGGGFGGTMNTSGIADFVGSSNGDNSFTADQTGGFSFSVPPAGQGSVNTLSFASSTNGVSVNVTSSTGSGNVTGLVGGNDTFSGISSFTGSPENDIFTVGSGSYGFTGGGGTDSLSFALTTNAVVFNLTSSPPSMSGTNVNDTASGITQFTGNALGKADFVAAAGGGYGFTGLGSSNQLDLSLAPAGITIDAQHGLVSGLSVGPNGTTDSFSDISVFDGSTSSDANTPTTFRPGCAGGESFAGVSGAVLDLSMSTCAAGPSLAVNTSASPGTVSPLPNGGSDTFTGVAKIDGPTQSGATFIAGGSGDGNYDFVGQSSGDTLDGSAFPAGAVINAFSGTAAIDATDSDTFSGMNCYVGSSAGDTSFVAPASALASSCSENGVNSNFEGKGTGNTLYLGDIGAAVAINPITGTVEAFPAGTTFDTFADLQTFSSCLPTSSVCPVNTLVSLDLSSWPAGTTVNTSTSTVSAPSTPSLSYSGVFGFIGSSRGDTTFVADPNNSYSFNGRGSGNTLDLTAAPSGITVNPACGQVVLAVGDPCNPPANEPIDTYTGITQFIGSGSGDTTFTSVTSSSDVFTGRGSGNTLDLSAAPAGISLDLTTNCGGLQAVALIVGENPCSSTSTDVDEFSGIQNFLGSSAGGTAFTAPGGSGGYTLTGRGSGNSLGFGSMSSGGLVVNDTTSPGTVATSSGTSPQWSDTFSSISSFSAPPSGNTVFDAPATGGVNFTGEGASDTLDLGASPAGTVVIVASSGPSTAYLGSSAVTDSFTGIACVAGSSAGGTSFIAGSNEAPAASGCADPGTPAVNFAGRGKGNSLDTTALSVGSVVNPVAGTVVTTAQPVATLDTFSSVTSFAAPATEPVTPSTPPATLDLSGMPAQTTVNAVTGVATPPTAAFPTITFSGFDGFIGSSSGGTTFDAPGTFGGQTFAGLGSSGNSLSFAAVPAGDPGVTINLASQEATSGALPGGPDVFSGMQAFTGSPNPDTFIDGAQSATLVGGGGADTLSFADASSPANATLGQSGSSGTASGGLGGSYTIEGIQNVTSSPGGGTITGNLQPSIFTGGGGNDTFVLVGGNDTVNGGGGSNTLDLTQAPGFVTLNLTLSSPQATGGAGVLTVAPGTIQTVKGSNAGNHIVAGTGTVVLIGGNGNDWLQAGSGNDTLDAGTGTDVLVGGPGFTTFVGGPGTDTFYPGSGNGQISDPTGSGILDEQFSPVGVQVNLGTSRYTTPSGVTLPPSTAVGTGTVSLSGAGLQEVVGSNFADILVGDSSANIIKEPSTNTAADLIVGLGGGDTLVGGAGADTFITGSGDNVVRGGSSGKNTIDYAQAPNAVNVNLSRGTASNNGYGGSDQLSGIEDIIGSPNADDSLTLGSKGAVVHAGNGTGVTITGSKLGDDTMYGGTGGDTFVSVGPGDTMRGGAGPNQFFANNGYKDYIYGGGVFATAVVDCIDVKDKTIHDVNRIIEPSGGCGTSTTTTSSAPAMGYLMATSAGNVYAFGDARFHGSMAGKTLPAPVVGMSATPDGGGYYLVTSKGNVYSFGKGRFHGSMAGKRLPAAVVGMATTPDGGGYYLVTSKGNVYGFGDARFHGSMAGKTLPAPVVAIKATSNSGYYLVTSKGNVYAFGGARLHGSLAGKKLPAPVVGMRVTANGDGYYLVTSKGNVYAFGGARLEGSKAIRSLPSDIVSMALTPDGGGYWLAESNGSVFAFGDAQSFTSQGRLPAPIVAVTGS